MRKSLSFVLIALMLCTLLPFNVFAVDADAESIGIDEIMLSIPTTKTRTGNSNATVLYAENSGFVTGPQDFCIDGTTIYILNSSDNTILTSSSSAKTVAKMELKELGVVGTRIAANNGALYVLTASNRLLDIKETGVVSYIVPSYITESVGDFKALNNNLYISCINMEGCEVTYCFEISDGAMTYCNSFAGRIANENTRYEVNLIREEGSQFGHSCTIQITNMQSGSNRSITMTSDYWISGAQYLGNYNGYDQVRLFEIASDSNYEIVSSDTLRLVDSTGQVVAIRDIPTQVVANCNSTKSFDAKLYQMNTNENHVEIAIVGNAAYVPASDYISPLDSIQEPENISTNNNADRSTTSLSRTKIVQNARACYEYSWTCTSDNLSTLTNWVCPSYITGPGTYTSIPYCWGGFDGTSAFSLKLSQGYNVGNASSTYVPDTCGLDCSGFVSICWELSERFYTGSISNYATAINVSSMLSGDALNIVSENLTHVALFYGGLGYGNYVVYECTKGNYDRVVYRTWSSISGYTAYKCNKVVDIPDPEDY